MRLRTRGQGPLVVMVPGLVGGTGMFEEPCAAARAAGFRVAALDTTGDRQDDPLRSPLSWDLLSAEVIGALDRERIERAVLWGISFGSLICLAAAARRPERVMGLALCFPPDPGWRPRLYRAVLRWCDRRRRPELWTGAVFHAGFVLLSAWELALPRALVRLPGLARAVRDAGTPPETVRQKLRLMWNERFPLLPDRTPASIIAGSLDTIAPVSGARRLAARLPGARLQILGGVGHGGTFSRPLAYRRWLLEELRRLAG